MLSALFQDNSRSVLWRSALLVVLIAVADWRIDAEIPLGFLYLLPMLLLGRVLSRWQIGAAAAVCTVLTEAFNSLRWTPAVGLPRDILTFAAFSGIGLFVYGVVRNRRASSENLLRIEREIAAREDAEEQLKVLIESSPAAIFTTDAHGVVLLANEAAHKLFGAQPASLPGTSIHRYFPSLLNLPSAHREGRTFRTVMQCRGTRQNGEVFLADIWFSTYRTSVGARLAAMVVDNSETLRTHEESSLHQLLTGSRILVSAVSHEIRNVCAAIAVVHQNLSRGSSLENSKDFEAFGTLIQSLEKIAAMDLQRSSNRATSVDLHSLLDELRIVVEPALEENGITLNISVDTVLPEVLADRPSLMQVFLNLIKNSERAMLRSATKNLHIVVRTSNGRVLVQFVDSGSGVQHPAELFKPFQQRAESTGLGLYLSRAFMRSFQGDLHFEPTSSGACFVVELSAWQREEAPEYESVRSNFDR
ncbi:ATP-binding protein [Granulicella sp. S190]|uniref:ATP-binding protein n=1 Tax=Granulicella sp. S190 TaxID=1747226 RepID=UPI00131D516E|nr:ATP-binding protein [Granulicella sp. S190]